VLFLDRGDVNEALEYHVMKRRIAYLTSLGVEANQGNAQRALLRLACARCVEGRIND
jgi:hypothetical protein